MSLVTVERIKLFSTRSPWWCMATALVLADGFITLGFLFTPDDTSRTFRPSDTQGTYLFGMVVMMVMATLAVTTEYRFGTIRTSFLSVPKRLPILVSKTLVAAVLAGVVGLITAFGAWALGSVLVPDADLALNSAADVRAVAGVGVVYFFAAVISVALGILIRQSAGAVAAAVCWPLLLEGIGLAIPKVGDFIADWGPFSRANWFINGDQGSGSTSVMSPGWSLVYYAAWAIGLLVIALAVAKKRDA